MKEYDLNQLLDNSSIIDAKIKELLEKNVLRRQSADKDEIMGHILKAENNLRFVSENIKIGFPDWAIAGCYYACYHAALGLILTKGYSSKSHLATLCIIIRDFYKKELNMEDIELLSKSIDHEDILFYVESKNKREDATYSTSLRFDKKEAEQLRIKSAMFVTKIKSIIYA